MAGSVVALLASTMTHHAPQHQQAQGVQGQQQPQGAQATLQPEQGQQVAQRAQEPVQEAQQQVQQAQQYAQQAQSQQGAGAQAPVFQTANFLPEEVRTASAQTLNQVLADAIVVVSQVKNAHWNVRGPNFYQLHELFEDVAEAVEDYIDEIAERATALGGVARGSVQEAARDSTVPPMPEGLVSEQALLDHVAQTLSAFDAQLFRAMETIEQYEDLDTIDLLNELSRDVSKALWFVEAHLQVGQQGAVQQGAIQQQSGIQQSSAVQQ